MDRKSIVAIVLAVLVIGWAQYQTQQEMKRSREAQAAVAAEEAAKATPAPEPTAKPVAPTTTPAPAVEAAPVVATPAIPEQKFSLQTPVADYEFTNQGGGIATLRLLKHAGVTPGSKMVLNSAASHPMGALLLKPEDADNASYEARAEGDRVIFERTLPNGIHLTKTYTVSQKAGDDYRVGLTLAYTNRGAASVEQPASYLFIGSAAPLHTNDIPYYLGFDWFGGKSNAFITPNWFNASKIPLVGIETSPAKPVYTANPGNVTWAGVRDQYFTTIILPNEGQAEGVWARPVSVKIDNQDLKGVEGFLELAPFKLAPGESVTKQFTLYSGPAEHKQLSALGHEAVQMMNIDRWWITRSVGSLLLRSMIFLEGFLHSYAWAIIVLTFIVRGLLWPIQGKANKSMKRMQLLQPKMVELKEKYKDNPTQMNQEVMKLYKDYGVNPVSGCLPMVIQIPIFIGFYSMLGTAVELRGSSFLWVHDLSRPDTIMHLAGIPLNILPLMMAATMVWQMQLTPKAGDPAQQKMMMFMPLVFVFVTYNFASALALYYTVQNILSIFQLYVTRNQPMPELARVDGKKNRR
jgi:YidC/Oxa1 family membrane protein insertase